MFQTRETLDKLARSTYTQLGCGACPAALAAIAACEDALISGRFDRSAWFPLAGAGEIAYPIIGNEDAPPLTRPIRESS